MSLHGHTESRVGEGLVPYLALRRLRRLAAAQALAREAVGRLVRADVLGLADLEDALERVVDEILSKCVISEL